MKNETNTNSDSDGIRAAEMELEEAKSREFLKSLEELDDRISISKEVTHYNPADLTPHPVNSRLYNKDDICKMTGHLLLEGQLNNCLFWIDPETGILYIVSGHLRVAAGVCINEKRLKRRIFDPDSTKNYHKGTFKPFEIRGQLITIKTEDIDIARKLIIRLVASCNMQTPKSPLMKMKLIKSLHRGWIDEGKRIRNNKLLQYSDSANLQKRHPKPIDSSLSNKEHIEKLINDGIISENEVHSSDLFKKEEKEDKFDTREKIRALTGESDGSIQKYLKLDEFAQKYQNDHIGEKILSHYDSEKFAIDTALNLFRLLDIQKHFEPENNESPCEIYQQLEDRIQKALSADPKDKSIVKADEVSKFEAKLNAIKPKEEKKKKDTRPAFDVNYMELNDPSDKTPKLDVSVPSTSALFIKVIFATLKRGISLLETLNYTGRAIYYFENGILLLGIKGDEEFLPKILHDKIGDFLLFSGLQFFS